MPKKKATVRAKATPPTKQVDGFYKDYDIEWLRGIGEEHPDYYLVAEFDALKKEK